MNLKPTPLLLCEKLVVNEKKREERKEQVIIWAGCMEGQKTNVISMEAIPTFYIHWEMKKKGENTLDFHDINHIDRFSAYDEVLSIWIMVYR